MVNRGGGSSSRGSRGRGFGGRQSYLRGSFGRGSLGRGSSSPSVNDDVNNVAPRTTSLDYHLHDDAETPDSIDSVGTSCPNNLPVGGTSRGPSTSSPITTLAAQVAAAEVRASTARANASAAAEIAAAAVAAAAAAAEVQAIADAAQAVATAAVQADEEAALHDEFPNVNKILLNVVPGRIPRFQPSTASKMNYVFKQRVDEAGSNWTKVTPEMKAFYWEEFKKYFIWARGADEAVKQCWKKAVSRRYCDFINDRKKDSVRKDYIPENVWNKWKADWNKPEALEISRKKRLARMGGNEKCSRHTGGSITTSEHAIRFEAKNKRKPTCNELFELTHRRKDKTFADEKSANIYAAFKTKKLQLSQLSDESIVVPDDDAIFLEIVGGANKHGDIYGLGSQSSSYIDKKSSSSASSSTLPQQVSVSLMQDFVERSLTDFGLQNEENVGRRIGKAVESRMSPYESALLQMQNLLASLTTTLQGQGFNQRKGVGSNGEDEDFGEDDLNDSD